MSRIGRMPIPVPSGTKVQIQDGTLVAEGPRGKVAQPLFEGYPVKIEDGVVTIERTGETGPERAKHGLLRALLNDALTRPGGWTAKSLDSTLLAALRPSSPGNKPAPDDTMESPGAAPEV